MKKYRQKRVCEKEKRKVKEKEGEIEWLILMACQPA